MRRKARLKLLVNGHGGHGVEGKIRKVPGKRLIIRLGTYHCAVVAAKLKRRNKKPQAAALAFPVKQRPQTRICRNAAGSRYGFIAALFGGKLKPVDQRVADYVLVRGAKIRNIYFFAALFGIVKNVHNGGFKPGKAHIKRRALYAGLWQAERLGISLLRHFIKRNSAGIRKTHGPRRLVKGFARGVITGFPENFEFRVVGNFHNMAVTAGNHKA